MHFLKEWYNRVYAPQSIWYIYVLFSSEYLVNICEHAICMVYALRVFCVHMCICPSKFMVYVQYVPSETGKERRAPGQPLCALARLHGKWALQCSHLQACVTSYHYLKNVFVILLKKKGSPSRVVLLVSDPQSFAL